MNRLFNGRMLTYHVFKGVSYLRSYAMKGYGISHGYDYYIPLGNGNYKHFEKYDSLKTYINALVEVDKAKERLAKLA